MELARSLAQGPSIALGLMKRNLNYAESGGLAELLDLEAVRQEQCGRIEDHREAAKAFVEKRAPIFHRQVNRKSLSATGARRPSGPRRIYRNLPQFTLASVQR